MNLHGVITPLATPLTAELDLDIPALERLVAAQLSAGVHGLFVLGSTGEAPYLGDECRREVINVVRAAIAGAVPLLVGVIDTAGERVVARAVEAERLGADAVVVTPPFFAAMGDEVITHYRQVAERIGIPVVMYHIPSRTGNSVAPGVMVELAESKVIAAVKDSGPDFASFRQMLVATEHLTEFTAFTGSEVLVDAAILAGAAGVMPGLANVDPAGFVRLYEAALRADWDSATAEQIRLARLLRIVDLGPSRAGPDGRALVAFKEAMLFAGLIDSVATCATPRSMGEAERVRLHDELRQLGLADHL